jgi:hypothetical protein
MTQTRTETEATRQQQERNQLRPVKPGRELLARIGAGVALISTVVGIGAKKAQADTILDTLTGTTLSTAGSGIGGGLGGNFHRIPLSSLLTTHDCRITNLETVFAVGSNRTPDQLGGISFYFGSLTTWQSPDTNVVQAGTYSARVTLTGYDFLGGLGTSASPAKYRLKMTTNDTNFTAAGGVTYMAGFTVGLNNGDIAQAAITETALTPTPPTIHARVLRVNGGANQFGFYDSLQGFPALYNGVVFSGQDVSSTSAPEPGTLALAGLGLGAGALIARRRRKN